MRTRFFSFASALLLVAGSFVATSAQAQAPDGGALFEQKCSGCHVVSDKVLVGPGLLDVTKRRERKWIAAFIRNSQGVVKSGDPTAVALFAKFKVVMPEHPIPEEEIQAIITFIEGGGVSTTKRKKVEEASAEEIEKGRALFTGHEELPGGAVSCNSCHSAGDAHVKLGRLPGPDLTQAFYLRYPQDLDTVLGNLEEHEHSKMYRGIKLSAEEIFNLKAFLYSVDQKGPGHGGVTPNCILAILVGLLVLIAWFYITKTQRGFHPLTKKEKFKIAGAVFLVLLLAGLYAANIIGRSANYNTGYAPIQPIPFSHKLHAGVNKIACQYCHFASEQGRHAGIPPTELCLNCHSQVKKDSPIIAQVKEAFDSGKNIEWIKVNHFPDHAFFSHAQHVRIAGFQCQQCHGPVETMDVLKQVKPLSMGWCIQCHRTNGIAPPEDHKSAKGGDCARCHH